MGTFWVQGTPSGPTKSGIQHPAFVMGGTAEAILAFVNGSAAVTVEELINELTTLWLVTGNGAADVARARVRGEG